MHKKNFVAAAWVALALLATLAPVHASHVGEDLVADQQTLSSTNQLLGALGQWQNAPAAVRDARLAQLVQRAAERSERLARLIERNPRVAAARLMPSELRAQLPAQARAFVEEDVTLSGSVFAAVGSDVARGLTTQRFLMRVDGVDYELALGDATGGERELLGWAGRRVTLSASKLDRKLLLRSTSDVQVVALDGLSGTSGATTPTTTPVVSGDQKTLVILAHFNDKSLACTALDVNTRLFAASGSSVNTSFRESSRNGVSFSGTVAGPYTIPYSSTGSCNYSGWASAAESAAKTAGFDPAQYKRINIVTPSNSTCGWSGLAYMPGTRSWVQSCGSTGIYTHELGHNLALHHSGSPTAEYGDGSDPMGGARNVRNNGAQQVMAGWVPTGGLLDVGSGGTYSIAALGPEAGTQPQVLRLAKLDTNERYYVSLRGALGLDAALSTGYLNNVAVHKATGTLPSKTTLLASLAAGQSFVDSVNGITITNAGLAANSASVDVTMSGATCARSTPTVTLNPTSRSAAPGASVGYSATLTNRNSAACGSSAFGFASSLPTGFSASVSPASVTLAAGASSTVSWSVTSPSGALGGTYDLVLAAGETSVTNSTSVHGSLLLLADSDLPSVAFTSPSAGATLSGRVTLTASASDSSGIARVEFYDGSGKLLGSDASAPYSANWNLRKAAKGPQTISVKAFDSTGKSSSASLAVTAQ